MGNISTDLHKTYRKEIVMIKEQNDKKRHKIYDRAQKLKNTEIESLRKKLEMKEKQRETSFKKLVKNQNKKMHSVSVKRQAKQDQ
jgi:hypothetical protein